MEERVMKGNGKDLRSNLTMENRNRLNVTGVLDVVSFDDESVVLETELGGLIVRGQGFRINKLNVDIGEITVEGDIDSTGYEESYAKPKVGLFSRIFK